MKYLHAGAMCCDRLTWLIKLTSIRSEDIKEALMWHLVKGHQVETAAALAGVKSSNLVRAIDTLEVAAEAVEKIKEIDYRHVK